MRVALWPSVTAISEAAAAAAMGVNNLATHFSLGAAGRGGSGGDGETNGGSNAPPGNGKGGVFPRFYSGFGTTLTDTRS